jgi:hypothetical protein
MSRLDITYLRPALRLLSTFSKTKSLNRSPKLGSPAIFLYKSKLESIISCSTSSKKGSKASLRCSGEGFTWGTTVSSVLR